MRCLHSVQAKVTLTLISAPPIITVFRGERRVCLPQFRAAAGRRDPFPGTKIKPLKEVIQVYHISLSKVKGFLKFPGQVLFSAGEYYIYYRQYRTKPACRLCVASADEFSVISHRNSLQYASIPASFLCNLTKNLLAHLPHNLCAVLPKIYARKSAYYLSVNTP